MTPEAKVKHHVKPVLTRLEAWWYMPVQTGMGVAGAPDFLCCVPVVITPQMVGKRVGVFMGVETKAPGKVRDLRPAQELQIGRIHAASGKAFVTDSPAIFQADVLDWLSDLRLNADSHPDQEARS